MNASGYVNAQFGPRTAQFALITEYGLAENARLHDRALFCTRGPLVAHSFEFNIPGVHRGSPWFRVAPLHLNSVAEATERYREFADAAWEAMHGGRPHQRQTATGELEDVPHVNPYAKAELAETQT